jgi:hypothetical protein
VPPNATAGRSEIHLSHKTPEFSLKLISSPLCIEPTVLTDTAFAPGPHAPPGAAVHSGGAAQAREEPGSDIRIDQERKAAILGAMKNIQLDYIPPWAVKISENEFEKEVKAAVERKGPKK